MPGAYYEHISNEEDGMRMGAWVCALALGLGASAQEEVSPKERLKAGLESSIKAGGFKIEGRVDQDNGMGGMKIPGLALGDGSLAGRFTGVVGADGTVFIKLEMENGLYELYRQSNRVVQRQTWVGKQEQVGGFANEIFALLDLSHLLREMEKVKDVRAGETKTIDGVECTALKLKFSPDFVPEEGQDLGLPGQVKLFEVRDVDASVYVGQADKHVRRVEMTLTRGLSSMIRMASGMGEDEDDGEGEDEGGGMPGLQGFRMSSAYEVTVGGYDSALRAEIPQDVKKHLEE